MVYWWCHHQHSSLVASANMLSRSSDLESKFFNCLKPICSLEAEKCSPNLFSQFFYVLQMDHNTSSTANCILTGTTCGDVCRYSYLIFCHWCFATDYFNILICKLSNVHKPYAFRKVNFMASLLHFLLISHFSNELITNVVFQFYVTNKTIWKMKWGNSDIFQ